ncbi:hypothetical protein I3842_Q082300 [Carya illinoinensis]|uniref:DUF4408 domain-containing protein n=1 Tax=Carya illinoinensis TaxID=32201 RepID=A0A922A2M1_CARIL|nr:hypothetical protein I3842_Q082300 [Carya illinoinensis]
MFRIAKLFRYAELCLAVVLISWAFTRVPFALKISAEYFWKLSGFVVSHVFIFMLCNVIIVTLIAKSGRFSGQNPTGHSDETELFEEFIKHVSGGSTEPQPETRTPAHDQDVIVYHDKQIICEVNRTARKDEDKTETDSDTDIVHVHPKAYRRTQSEKIKRQSQEKSRGELRRSDTEKCRKGASSDEKPQESQYPEDKLSNEEFQRTIDAFIAKHWKFHSEESLPIVLHNQIQVPVGN